MDIKISPIAKIVIDRDNIECYNKSIEKQEKILVPTDSFFSIGYDEHGKERFVRIYETKNKNLYCQKKTGKRPFDLFWYASSIHAFHFIHDRRTLK